MLDEAFEDRLSVLVIQHQVSDGLRHVVVGTDKEEHVDFIIFRQLCTFFC